MVNINTEAVLTTFTRLGRFLSLRCLVILDFNTALCSPCGLATAIGHISVITLLSRLHNAILVASRPIRLLPRYFLHLCYVGAYALRNSLPLAVWLRCRFIQAAIALFFDPSSVALLLMLVVGLRCVFCFDFCFLFPRSSPSIVVASACHHSVRLHSPALRPVFIQLARTGCLCL